MGAHNRWVMPSMCVYLPGVRLLWENECVSSIYGLEEKTHQWGCRARDVDKALSIVPGAGRVLNEAQPLPSLLFLLLVVRHRCGGECGWSTGGVQVWSWCTLENILCYETSPAPEGWDDDFEFSEGSYLGNHMEENQAKKSETSQLILKTFLLYKMQALKSAPVTHQTIPSFLSSVQLSSVAQLYPTLWDPMNRSTPGLPLHHQLPEFTQTHVHWVGDAIQPSPPLSSPSPPALNLSQHQGLFQRVNSSRQVAKVLEFQLQHQSFQWTPRTDLL